MLVQQSVAERFIELLLEKTRAVTYGDPMDPKTDMGTVIDEAAATLVRRQGQRCRRARCARLLYGNIGAGALYSPTVLDRVTPEMPLVKQETFGPVSPVIGFRDDRRCDPHLELHRLRAVVRRCAPTGSTTSRASSRELNVGRVNVREVPGYRLELTPFGGIKDSGLGYKEGVQEAIRSFTNTKTYSLPWP